MNKIPFIIILMAFILTVSIACKDSFYTQIVPINNNDLPHECNGLIGDINLSWKKSKRFGYYQSKRDFIFKELVIKYLLKKKCFSELNKKQIVELFGEPNKKEDSYFYYFLEKECFSDKKEDTAPYYCLYMVVEFDEQNMVVDLDRSLR